LPNVTVPGFLGNIPLFEATVGVIIIVGAIYYFIAQRGSAPTAAVTPASPQ
jgi:hypothetical protein